MLWTAMPIWLTDLMGGMSHSFVGQRWGAFATGVPGRKTPSGAWLDRQSLCGARTALAKTAHPEMRVRKGAAFDNLGRGPELTNCGRPMSNIFDKILIDPLSAERDQALAEAVVAANAHFRTKLIAQPLK